MAYFEGHDRKSVLRKTSIPIYKLFTRINFKRQTKGCKLRFISLSIHLYSIMCNFEPHRFFFKKKVNKVSVEVSYSYLQFPIPKYNIDIFEF